MENDEFDLSSLTVVDQRKTAGQQIWIVGCSYAHGNCLEYINQRYGQLVAEYYHLPVSFLTKPGSSIDWACDQILRADINPGDIVIWGITSVNRCSWVDDNHELITMGLGYLIDELQSHIWHKKLLQQEKNMFYNMLVDDSRCILGIRHIEQVVKFCEKLSIRLVLVAHDELSIPPHDEWLVSYLKSTGRYVPFTKLSGKSVVTTSTVWNFLSLNNYLGHRRYLDGASSLTYKTRFEKTYKDLGVDNLHPGPLTHQEWANNIIDYMCAEDKKNDVI